MVRWMPLSTAAGSVGAWLAQPAKPPRGAVIVLQEIFRMNTHTRAVTEGFAATAFVGMAPAVSDPCRLYPARGV